MSPSKQLRGEPCIVLIYLYQKIKQVNRGDIIKTGRLKDIIGRMFLCSKGYGGERKGIPRVYVYELIQDMINAALLERVSHAEYRILKSNCEKRLRKFPY